MPNYPVPSPNRFTRFERGSRRTSPRQYKRHVLKGKADDEQHTLGDLMEKNLIEVFGQRDSARREVAIAGISADCTFFEAEERIVGRDALNAKIERLLQEALDSCFARQGLRS